MSELTPGSEQPETPEELQADISLHLAEYTHSRSVELRTRATEVIIPALQAMVDNHYRASLDAVDAFAEAGLDAYSQDSAEATLDDVRAVGQFCMDTIEAAYDGAASEFENTANNLMDGAAELGLRGLGNLVIERKRLGEFLDLLEAQLAAIEARTTPAQNAPAEDDDAA